MRTMMFLNAILVASLVVSFAVVDTRDPIDWLLFFGSIGQWPIFLFYVLPKVIQKFCLISSIESNKDFELIKKPRAIIVIRAKRYFNVQLPFLLELTELFHVALREKRKQRLFETVETVRSNETA